jgi:hypothetical protein
VCTLQKRPDSRHRSCMADALPTLPRDEGRQQGRLRHQRRSTSVDPVKLSLRTVELVHSSLPISAGVLVALESFSHRKADLPQRL